MVLGGPGEGALKVISTDKMRPLDPSDVGLRGEGWQGAEVF